MQRNNREKRRNLHLQFAVDFTYISKAEFDEMVNSYKVMDIGMRPIGEYPFS